MKLPPDKETLDLFAARGARDDGMNRVEEHADKQVLVAWEAALKVYLHSHATFFCDDFQDWAKDLPRLREGRALGPIVMRAGRSGLMRKTGTFRKSVRSNLSEKPVWESLLYRGKAA